VAIPNILILDDASLKISEDATPTLLKELACAANHVELAPDTETTTVDTFCGSIDYPGTTKWNLVATLYQSFDVDATEDILSAAVAFDAPVAFEVVGYKSLPVSATNPAWSGLVRPKPYSPINGDAGEASTIELEWAITQGPTKRVTPAMVMASTHAELDEAAAAAGHTWSRSDLTVAEKQAELAGA
jgi:hypothetical protein